MRGPRAGEGSLHSMLPEGRVGSEGWLFTQPSQKRLHGYRTVLIIAFSFGSFNPDSFNKIDDSVQ